MMSAMLISNLSTVELREELVELRAFSGGYFGLLGFFRQIVPPDDDDIAVRYRPHGPKV